MIFPKCRKMATAYTRLNQVLLFDYSLWEELRRRHHEHRKWLHHRKT